ncbi:MAG TPA: Crp/Fnr family transcriptional regulator [Firmicutes bacterium]|nr:Crp/Fnr family transcriptional regulator [Bacillota bacterium]
MKKGGETPGFAPEELFLFRGLPPEAVQELLRDRPSPVEYAKGSAIYTPRQFRRALGVLLSGRAEVTRTQGGRRVLMNRLGPGDSFGAAALYGGGEAYVTEIRAVAGCRVLFLSQEAVGGMIRREPRVAENYIRFLSDRIRFLNRRIAGFTGGAADRRLARWLAERAGEDGEVRLPGMTALADALNVGRSSLYRSVDSLADAGLLRREGRKIFIVDIDRLREAAGEE